MPRHSFRMLLTLSLLGGCLAPIAAQEGGHEGFSFQDYRRQLLQGYADYRQGLLDDYDRFLEGVWRDYDAFRGIERDTVPKLPDAPVARPDDTPAAPAPPVTLQPAPEPADPLADTGQDAPTVVAPGPTPGLRQPDALSNGAGTDGVQVNFYGLTLSLPRAGVGSGPRQADGRTYADLWRRFEQHDVAARVVPALRQTADGAALNDWFTFLLVRAYVEADPANDTPALRMALTHHLMCHLGYCVRLALDQQGQPLLLVAIRQQVYARTYADVGGRRFYLFADSTAGDVGSRVQTFSTCDLPQDADLGRALDLMLTRAPQLSPRLQSFELTDGRLTLQGEVDANLMEALRHYPQMDIGCYARSVLCPQLRTDLAAQVRRQLQALPQAQAVDTLLHFVQHAFRYATDDEQHGYEKPYFFEETLYYPACDCEDRSVFYATLLRQALDADALLLTFPGHAAVVVALDPPAPGTTYTCDGRTYSISDPTYIGAVSGQCMPQFEGVRPTVE